MKVLLLLGVLFFSSNVLISQKSILKSKLESFLIENEFRHQVKVRKNKGNWNLEFNCIRDRIHNEVVIKLFYKCVLSEVGVVDNIAEEDSVHMKIIYGKSESEYFIYHASYDNLLEDQEDIKSNAQYYQVVKYFATTDKSGSLMTRINMLLYESQSITDDFAEYGFNYLMLVRKLFQEDLSKDYHYNRYLLFCCITGFESTNELFNVANAVLSIGEREELTKEDLQELITNLGVEHTISW